MSNALNNVPPVVEMDYPFPAKPLPLSAEQKTTLIADIKALLKERKAVLVAHYYTDPEIRRWRRRPVASSATLEMARFGRDHEAQTLIVAGVRFMGETSKILSPTSES